MQILLAVMAVLLVLVATTIAMCKLRSVRLSATQIQALAEALYQAGYEDQKAGRPEPSWEPDGSYALNQFHRDIIKAAQTMYQKGSQDALEGRPSTVKEIRELRKQQCDILDDMITTLRNIKNLAV